jgi:hypothetical protein
MKKLLVFLPFLVLAACGGKDKEANNPQPEAPVPLEKSQNSAAFNASFEKMLNDYYALKDAFTRSTKITDPAVDPAAKALAASADSLKISELKADSMLVSTAQMFAQSIVSDAKGLQGEKDLVNKRKSFQMMSDNMYNLMRTVKYDRAVAYYQYCPMAFDNQGAYWVSNKEEVINPYFANEMGMIHCGEVKETLDYRPKDSTNKK